MKKIIAFAIAVVLAGGGLFTLLIIGMMTMITGAASASACTDLGIGMSVQSGPTRLPVTGSWHTTSEWGMRHHPTRGGYSHHYGLDFVAGPAVVAAQGGVVTATPTTAGEGNQIVISHGGGVRTKYKHLSSRSVAKGQKVTPGQKIGVLGATGTWVTGPHLHFEVWKSGTDINPRKWLSSQGVKISTHGKAPGPSRGKIPDLTDVTPVNLGQSPIGSTTKDVQKQIPASVAGYNRAQLRNAAAIIKAGQAMDLNARTITIGVMTAMGESTLTVVDHGDQAGPDSRGLFQQRANGAWGSYSDRMNPRTSATNFFKALQKVHGYEGLSPTAAAHKTQHNADPTYYTRFWEPAKQVVAALTKDPSLLAALGEGVALDGCSDPVSDDLADGDGTGSSIVTAAKHYLGTPYSWGGGTISGPSRGTRTSASLDGTNTVGFDCSGLVLFAVHKATGIQLTHDAGDQGHDKRGKAVPRNWKQMQPGDVIAFSEDGSGRSGTFGHDGIYVGGGKMIHAPRPGKDVEVTQLKGVDYWESMSWSIRRYAS